MRLLSQNETNKLLKKYGLPIAKSKICTTFDECKTFANKNHFPLVLKIDSPSVIHKSDIGAVVININNLKELKEGYNKILTNVKKFDKDAIINGVLIQQQLNGHNLIIGMKKDPTFGPVLIFGLGGVLVEIFKDVTKRIAPINKTDAKQMIKEIKSYELLTGYRGEKEAHIDSLINILLNLSKMVINEKFIVELDFNPVISNEKNSFIVDARIMVEE